MQYNSYQTLSYKEKTGKLPSVKPKKKCTAYQLVWRRDGKIILPRGNYGACFDKRKEFIYPYGKYKRTDFLIKAIE